MSCPSESTRSHRRWRPLVPGRTIALLIVLCLLVGPGRTDADEPATGEKTPSPFSSRVVRVNGPLTDQAVLDHIEFTTGIGFNALWIPSSSAGRWWEVEGSGRPELFPEFLELAQRCTQRGIRIYLAVEPVSDAQGSIVLSDPGTAKRLARFLRLARRQAEVHDFVISFRGAGLRLTELTDLLVYGRVAAAAHVEVTSRVAGKLGSRDRLWFAPAIYSDEQLDDPRLRYADALIEATAGLDSRVGIVWSGPRTASPSIAANDVSSTRARFGGRPLMLDDRYPANGSGERLPLALILGPLRQRDAGLASEIAAYVSMPMEELGASRLALLTVADFLLDPHGYDADDSWLDAMGRLAGDHPDVLRALRTQASEWGGWIGTPNYHTALDDNPLTAAQSLRDPAAVASWSWPVRTYPERMAALDALDDARFRTDLLLTMARRLAVARAVPLVREIWSGPDPPGAGQDLLVNEIHAQRWNVAGQPQVLMALDRFLYHAGLGPLLSDQETSGESNPDE